MEKFAILQSGFVTDNLSRVERSEDTSIDFKSFILNKAYYRDSSKFFYFPIVNNLYRDYTNDNNLLNDIEFRERIIKVFFQVFDNKNIYEWIVMQNDFAPITSLHKQFILDTFEYVCGIKNSRSTPLSQWISLLTVQDSKKEFNLKSILGEDNKYVKIPIIELLDYWLSLPNGFDDLLITLFVLFGDRSTTNIY